MSALTVMSMGTQHIYDVARWKPIPHKAYVEELSDAFAEGGWSDQPPQMSCESLEDGRKRVILTTDVLKFDVGGDVIREPYLMILLGNGDTHCFIRTDVHRA